MGTAKTRKPRTPPDPEIARRLKLAYESMPRDRDGNLPDVTAIDALARVGRGTLGRAMAQKRGVSPETLKKLASALRCDPGWLLTGSGVAPGAAMIDIYPQRAAVLAGAIAKPIDPAVVAAVRAENWHAKDPGSDHWYDRIAYHAEKLGRLSRPSLSSRDETKR